MKKKVDDVNWIDISEYWNDEIVTNLNFVDLFSGAGGMSRGFEMAGLKGIGGLDFYKEAVETHRHNFNYPVVYGDISLNETKQELYDIVENSIGSDKLNIIAGGFPCQGFSLAGNRVVEDPRNRMYKHMLDIVKHLQSDFVVMENVVGLRSMLEGKVEEKIINDFKDAGYEINVTVLCAADYGVPQKRYRVIFIGNRIGLKNYHPKPLLTSDEYITIGEAIGDLMDLPETPEINHLMARHKPETIKRMGAVKEGESLYKGYSDSWKRTPWNEPAQTIKENHGGVNIHPKLPRVITPREMARLQSFPDDFIFKGSKNKQFVLIGNAVPPLLAKAIGISVMLSYEKSN